MYYLVSWYVTLGNEHINVIINSTYY